MTRRESKWIPFDYNCISIKQATDDFDCFREEVDLFPQFGFNWKFRKMKVGVTWKFKIIGRFFYSVFEGEHDIDFHTDSIRVFHKGKKNGATRY